MLNLLQQHSFETRLIVKQLQFGLWLDCFFYMKQQDSPPTTPPPNPTTIPTSWNFFYNSKVTTWKKYVQCLFSWQIICRISTQSETRYQIKLNQNKQDPTLFWEPESRFHYLSFKAPPSFFFFDFWNKKGLFHMFFYRSL